MTTTAAIVNFNFYPGATFTGSVTLNDSNGVPVDLTGYTALMHVRREKTDATPVLTLTTADGTITLGGAAGTITLLVSAAVTAAVEVDEDGESWAYDLFLTNTSPNPDTVERKLAGYVFATYAVTRSA